MLAVSAQAPFSDEGWWFEPKWDGYRCMAAVEAVEEVVRLRSRRGLDLTGRFPDVAALALPPGVVLDGEIVALDEAGVPSFSLLQRRGEAGAVGATLVVFDLLHHRSETLVGLPFEERRSRLAELDLPSTVVVSEPIAGAGEALFAAAVEQGLEGVVAKRVGSTYQPGRRSSDWRKVSARRRARAVVGGWLPGEGGRSSTFGSLLVGLWDGDALRWVGAVGSGFTDRQLVPIRETLDQISRTASPFADPRLVPRGARWVEPAIVISVEFREWTRDHHLRAPVFKGIDPTPPGEVTWEAERSDR